MTDNDTATGGMVLNSSISDTVNKIVNGTTNGTDPAMTPMMKNAIGLKMVQYFQEHSPHDNPIINTLLMVIMVSAGFGVYIGLGKWYEWYSSREHRTIRYKSVEPLVNLLIDFGQLLKMSVGYLIIYGLLTLTSPISVPLLLYLSRPPNPEPESDPEQDSDSDGDEIHLSTRSILVRNDEMRERKKLRVRFVD